MADTTPSKDLIAAITSSRDAYFAYRPHLRRTEAEDRLFAEAFVLGADSVLDHAATPPNAALADGWMPIETAPKDGRVLLLGYYNARGNWRTLRGEWVSEDEIAEYWENDDAEPGWYETAVEAEDPPNAWPTNPTHWRPLPAPPTLNASGEGQL